MLLFVKSPFLQVLIAILAVSLLAASFSLAMYWYARASTGDDVKARRRARVVEVLMAFALLAIYAVTETGRMRTLVIGFICLVAGLWLFRGAKLLLHRRSS